MQAFGNTFGDTGRIQALIDPIHAVVAFNRFTGRRIPLGGSPGACRNASLAADAEFLIHEDNAVPGSFLHGACGAGRHTPGILAVEAGHEYISHARQIVDLLGAHRNNLRQSGADGQVIFGFAVGLAAETPDAAFGILVDIVLAHACSSKYLPSFYVELIRFHKIVIRYKAELSRLSAQTKLMPLRYRLFVIGI
jgi:hypothetical protein